MAERGGQGATSTVAVMHTSGTTAAPKPVELTYGNFQASALGSAVALGLDPAERWLCPMPLTHVGGLSIPIRSAIYATTAVLHGRFETDAVLNALMDPARADHARLARADDARAAARRRARASADAALGAARRRPDRAGAARARRAGRRAGRADVRDDRGVLADRDVRLAAAGGGARGSPGPSGEITSAGRSSRPAAVDDDGWLHTGDLGRFDERGRLEIIGRKADTIVSGGENVAPAEVEAVLLSHPAVADAAVFGRADRSGGRRSWPRSCCATACEADPEELRAFCAAQPGAVQGAEGDRVRRGAAADSVGKAAAERTELDRMIARVSTARSLDDSDSPNQLTIEQLAAESGMSVRNIRAHQARGLLSPPEVRMRVGYYGPEHVSQLRLIRELQNDGFNLGGIKRLLEDTEGTAERLLRFKDALSAASPTERAETITLRELARRFRVSADEAPEVLAEAQRLGVIVPTGEDQYEVPSPSLLAVAEEVVARGVSLQSALAVLEEIERHWTRSRARSSTCSSARCGSRSSRRTCRPSAGPRSRQAVERLRPIASEALITIFQQRLSTQIEGAFGEITRRLSERTQMTAEDPDDERAEMLARWERAAAGLGPGAPTGSARRACRCRCG